MMIKGKNLIEIGETAREFLYRMLKADKFDNLQQELGIQSPHMTTKILKSDIGVFPAEYVLAIARLSGIHAFVLVDTYSLGCHTVSASQYNFWRRDYEKKESTTLQDKAA